MILTMLAVLILNLVALPAVAGEPPADRILVNGRILTVDAMDRVAEAIAIRNGRIVAVGTTAESERLAGPATERIDLRGRTATPGLIDAHVHFSHGGLMRLTYIDLSFPAVKSIADVIRLVAERRAATKAGEWILGRGWDEGEFAERRLIAAPDLDPPGNGNPVWLVHTTGHYGVANGRALETWNAYRDVLAEGALTVRIFALWHSPRTIGEAKDSSGESNRLAGPIRRGAPTGSSREASRCSPTVAVPRAQPGCGRTGIAPSARWTPATVAIPRSTPN